MKSQKDMACAEQKLSMSVGAPMHLRPRYWGERVSSTNDTFLNGSLLRGPDVKGLRLRLRACNSKRSVYFQITAMQSPM